MRRWIYCFIIIVLVTILCFIYIDKNADYSKFLDIIDTKFESKKLDYFNDEKSIEVYVNQNFSNHNTSLRNGEIEYIVIHYTGTTKGAVDIINYYNSLRADSASADFFVDLNGDIYQYNPVIDFRYSWAVGGDKKDNFGGSLYGVVTNENSISIELCVSNDSDDLSYNSEGWYFSEQTINSAVDLVNYLMGKYDIDKFHVIRHYDVSGKECPGVVGWNEESGSNIEWLNFVDKLK